MRARTAAVILLVAGAFGATPARADGGDPPGLWSEQPASVSSGQAPREKRYYGWKFMPVDLASTALIAVGPDGVKKAAFAGYLANGLVVHTLQGNGNDAGRSFLMRAGLPALGWVIGGLVGGLTTEAPCSDGCDENGCGCGNDWIRLEEFWGHDGAVAGGFVGLGLAFVLDWTVLGWANESVSTERSILVPRVTIDDQGLAIGVLGQF